MAMAQQPDPAHGDLEAFLADIGFGLNAPPTPTPVPLSQLLPMVTSSGSGTVATGDDGSGDSERRLRRKISNRESARRSLARKQRHLEEQHALAAKLRAENRDLAAQLRVAGARTGLVALANDRLRAEGQALVRRLAAARRALALGQLYAPASAGGGLDMQTLASLISERTNGRRTGCY